MRVGAAAATATCARERGPACSALAASPDTAAGPAQGAGTSWHPHPLLEGCAGLTLAARPALLAVSTVLLLHLLLRLLLLLLQRLLLRLLLLLLLLPRHHPSSAVPLYDSCCMPPHDPLLQQHQPPPLDTRDWSCTGHLAGTLARHVLAVLAACCACFMLAAVHLLGGCRDSTLLLTHCRACTHGQCSFAISPWQQHSCNDDGCSQVLHLQAARLHDEQYCQPFVLN